MTTYFRGKEVVAIGVYRTDHASAEEAAGGGMHGNISTIGHSASAIRDWIDMGDAVRNAWGAGDECAYAVQTEDDKWHTLEDYNDLLDAPTTRFKVIIQRTQTKLGYVEASSREEAMQAAQSFCENWDDPTLRDHGDMRQVKWCDQAGYM